MSATAATDLLIESAAANERELLVPEGLEVEGQKPLALLEDEEEDFIPGLLGEDGLF